MSVSPISHAAAASVQAKPAPAPHAAADGDSPAVEKAESASKEHSEVSNGGFAPKAPASGVNKFV